MSTPDHSDVLRAQKSLTGALKKLHALAPELGMARQVIEYDSDRRKSLLAKYMVKHLRNGDSSASSEAQARSDESYIKELDCLAEICKTAHSVRADWDATYASWESARSVLAMQRETLKTLPE